MEALERLGRKCQLIIVTNSNRLFVGVLAQPVIRYFDHVFSTTLDFGLLKKNPDAYRRVCIEPSEMVHVGDRVLDDFNLHGVWVLMPIFSTDKTHVLVFQSSIK
ncbi:MAG: HAD family hydrolase [Candidatus Bathyarchaeia archaeon]